jgi:ERF superfamily protein
MATNSGPLADASSVQLEVLPQIEIGTSPEIGTLIEALAKAQLEYKPVLKQNENAAFTRGTKISYYADLATYIDATQAALAKNGLVVTQWPTVSPEAKSMTLVSILAHSSGQWMRGNLTLPALGREGFTAHSCGSSITYARRYSYAAITGCASEDDDGNAASGRGSSEAAQAVAKNKIMAHETKKQNALLYTLPEAHNAHFAEFLNLKHYIAEHQEQEDSLRMVFTSHKAKKTKDETVLVPSESLAGLLEKLAGDFGITVKELKANA